MRRVDESAELRLTGEQLTGKVADVRDADILRRDLGRVQRAEDRRFDQLVQTVCLRGEVALVPAEPRQLFAEIARLAPANRDDNREQSC